MIYKKFQNENISLLGFGCMRFPMNKETNKIDEELTEKMVDYAIEHGVNYFDTAAPYHDGMSELVIGKILKKYPRDKFYLADKYPGHQIKPGLEDESTKPEVMFENQLKKCGVEYFDFYLLHNVCENSYGVYTDKQRGLIEYFVSEKKKGRIKHLGFSSHGSIENLKDFVENYGKDMEFCQIQLNYLDWTLQKAKEKYEYLSEKKIPIWVMEPVRGGALVSLKDEFEEKMKKMCPDNSIASWGFRWLQGLENINVTLSGMSSFEQVKDNIETYDKLNTLTNEEYSLINEVVNGFSDFVPCTACKYCMKECPQNLDIPGIIASYNDLSLRVSFTPRMYIEALPEGHKPSDCLACGACEKQCPQKIKISEVMSKCADILAKNPTWEQVCKDRFEVSKKK